MISNMGQCLLTGLLIITSLHIGCAKNQTDVSCPDELQNAPDPQLAQAEKLDYSGPLKGASTMEEAVAKVAAALSGQGFGIVTDMDVQAIMKKKLGKEMRPYRILGACNPKLAYQAIEQEKIMGLLLPCKVIVYQEDDDQFWVSFARPTAVFQLIPNPDLEPLAKQVDELIRQAFESL